MTKDEQLTPQAQELVPRLREKQRIQRRAPVLTATMIAALVMIVGALVYGFASYTAADDVLKKQQQQNVKSIGDLQEQMKGVCRKVDDFGKLTTQEREGCYRAENSIPPIPPSTPNEPVATPEYQGLSPSQIQAMINQSLATLPRPLTIDDVIRAATDVYKANPPKDGKDVTPEQVAATVIAVCGVEECRGPKGEDGKDAPPSTDSQILAQVTTFCSGPGEPCRSTVAGPPGQSPACLSEPTQCVGPQGVGISTIERHCENPSEPYLRFVFDRPRADGSTGYDVPMPVTFCVP
jgi:hypothetical protein